MTGEPKRARLAQRDQVYARADFDLKRQALAQVFPDVPRPPEVAASGTIGWTSLTGYGGCEIRMIGMGLWTLKPDTLDASSASPHQTSAFFATYAAFLIAEIGDKTQIATMALAAAYTSLAVVVAGTTLGMLLANAP